MPYSPDQYHRHSIRLPGYDYAQEGIYFLTLCTQHREYLFGEVIQDTVALNDFGQIIQAEWLRTAIVRPYISLDEFIVMPNHLHGLIVVNTYNSVGATRRVAPTTNREAPNGPAPRSIGAIIAQYKSITTKRINALRGTPGISVWQRNYYEHVVRNEESLNEIRVYIQNNPLQWEADRDVLLPFPTTQSGKQKANTNESST